MAGLDIFLFGAGRISHQPAGIEVGLPPAGKALLGYLVLNRDRPHHRDVLASTFWPEVGDACARNRLSTALWRLRQALEPGDGSTERYLLTHRRGSVEFNPQGDYWLDVATFEQGASALINRPLSSVGAADIAAFEQVRAFYRDDLLQGIDLQWLVLERERLSQLYLTANAVALEWYVQAGQLDAAAASGQRILERDPLREDIHRALIRLFAQSNQRAKARKQFEACRTVLEEELGVVPLPETIAAAVQVASPTTRAENEPLDAESAADLIDAASRTLGVAASELEQISRSLRKLTGRH